MFQIDRPAILVGVGAWEIEMVNRPTNPIPLGHALKQVQSLTIPLGHRT